jgi:hypothetical protein
MYLRELPPAEAGPPTLKLVTFPTRPKESIMAEHETSIHAQSLVVDILTKLGIQR